VKSGEKVPDVSRSELLSDVESTVLYVLQEVSERVRGEKDVSKLESYGSLLSIWLDVLNKVRKSQQI